MAIKASSMAGAQSFGDDEDDYDGRWISVGYPTWFFNGNRPAVEFDIDIDDIDNDAPGLELETNYSDAFGGGWSGGSLWGVINNGFKSIGTKSGREMDGYDPALGLRGWHGKGQPHQARLGEFSLD